MIEQQTSGSLETGVTTVDPLWAKLQLAVPGTTIQNQRSIEDPVKVLFTLCPLYAQGSLEQSALLTNPTSIAGSRVAGKWDALKLITYAIKDELEVRGQELDVTIVFANRGVLLGHDPKPADSESLLLQEEIYRIEMGRFFDKFGIPHVYETYDTLEVSLPTFVNTQTPIPPLSYEGPIPTQIAGSIEGMLIATINDRNEQNEIPTHLVNNKRNRHKITSLMSAFGPPTSYQLVSGYLAFDYMIPRLIGPDGIYLSTERFAPLFRIASLTPDVKEMTRVEIPA